MRVMTAAHVTWPTHAVVNRAAWAQSSLERLAAIIVLIVAHIIRLGIYSISSWTPLRTPLIIVIQAIMLRYRHVLLVSEVGHATLADPLVLIDVTLDRVASVLEVAPAVVTQIFVLQLAIVLASSIILVI